MKKTIAIVLVVSVLLCICSCEGETEVVSSDLPSAVTPTPIPAESPEPTETPTPTETTEATESPAATPTATPTPTPAEATPRPDGLYDVDGLSADLWTAVEDSDVLVVYHYETKQLLRYDSEKTGFVLLGEYDLKRRNYLTVDENGMIDVNTDSSGRQTLVHAKTGKKSTRLTVLDGKTYLYDDEQNVFYCRGTTFSVKEKDGYKWYEYPEELEGYGHLSSRIAFSNGRHALIYDRMLDQDDDPTYNGEEACYFFVYDFTTGKQSKDYLCSEDLLFGVETTFLRLSDTLLSVDGMKVDMTRVVDKNYTPSAIDVTDYSSYRQGEMFYYRDGNTVRVLQADGTDCVVYTHPEGAAPMERFCVTAGGHIVVIGRESYREEGINRIYYGPVYVDGKMVCEQADELLYATDSRVFTMYKNRVYANGVKMADKNETFVYGDENNLIVRKTDGRLRLIPLT